MEESNDSAKVVEAALLRMRAGSAIKERRIKRATLFCVAILLAAAVWILSDSNSEHFDGRMKRVVPPETFALEDGRIGIRLKEDRQGHFYVTGTVNGHQILFLVDTGASSVHLPDNVARKIGLQEGGRSWASTANGLAPISTTSIRHMDIGGLSSRNVRASFGAGMNDGAALLGMTYLRQYDMSTSNGVLELVEKER